jgi:hypothetical protein
VDHLEGKGGEIVVSILKFQGVSSRLCQLRIMSFWPRWQALTCTDRMSGLWRSINTLGYEWPLVDAVIS